MPRVAPALLVLLAVMVAPSRASTTEDANKALVRKMIEAVNARDLDALDAIVAADVVRHSAATAGLVVRSLDDFKSFLRADFAAVPDSVITVENLLAEDDLVAVHAIYAGTQQGAMGPFPATGEKMEGPFLSVLRIEDGKIAEIWVEWDNLHMLSQLGHLPAGGADGDESGDAASDVAAGTAWEGPGPMEDLIELNREVLERLLVHQDPTKLDEVALEEFLVIAPGGKVETKEEAIAGVGSLDVRSVEITDHRVLARGDTVVLIGKIDADGTMRPLGELPPTKFLTVFIRVDGEWRMLARSLTMCAPLAIEHGVC